MFKELYNKLLDYLAKKSNTYSELKEQLQKEQKLGKKTNELYQQSLKSNQESEEKNKKLSKLNQGLERKIQISKEQTNNFKQKYESEFELRTKIENKENELEQQLIKSEKKASEGKVYEYLFRVKGGINNCLIAIDPEYKIKEISPAAEETLGCRRKEFIGKSLNTILGEQEFERFRTINHEAAMSNFFEKFEDEVEIKNKDGRILCFETYNGILKDNKGGYEGTVIILDQLSSFRKRISSAKEAVMGKFRKEILGITAPKHIKKDYAESVIRKIINEITIEKKYPQAGINLVKTEKIEKEALDLFLHYQKICHEKHNGKIIYCGLSDELYAKFKGAGFITEYLTQPSKIKTPISSQENHP